MKTTVLKLALKRIQFLVAAILVTSIAPELISKDFSWVNVELSSRVALGYWLITTFRDWQDPQIPNK